MTKQILFCTIAVLAMAFYPIVATQNLTAAKSLMEIDSSEEYQNALVTGLRNDFRAGFAGILNFFNLTNTGFRKLVKKVTHLETQQKVNADVEKDFGNKLQQLQHEMFTTIHFILPFSQLVIGTSFGGKTLEEISKSIAGQIAVAVQIKNYLNVPLSGYKINLSNNVVAVLASPPVINARTTEVFTFKNSGSVPQFAFLYRIGTTDFALHAFIASNIPERWLAVALLNNFENPRVIYKSTPCENVSTNAAACRATNGWVTNATEKVILNANEGDLHVSANMKYVSNGKHTVVIELFGEAKIT